LLLARATGRNRATPTGGLSHEEEDHAEEINAVRVVICADWFAAGG
jgi:hypothetical protein